MEEKKQNRKRKFETEEALELVEQGYTYKDIAIKFGCNAGAVRRRVLNHYQKCVKKGIKPKGRPETYSKLRKVMFDCYVTQQELANELGITIQDLHDRFKNEFTEEEKVKIMNYLPIKVEKSALFKK